MTEELQELYIKLKQYSNFDKEENAENFLDIADRIVLKEDPSSIKELLKYFKDTEAHTWVLESLKVRIEHYKDDFYVEEILKNLEELMNRSPYWSINLIYSIFNNSNCFLVFCENLHLTSKKTMLKLFDVMEKKSSHYHNLIEELKRKVNEKIS